MLAFWLLVNQLTPTEFTSLTFFCKGKWREFRGERKAFNYKINTKYKQENKCSASEAGIAYRGGAVRESWQDLHVQTQEEGGFRKGNGLSISGREVAAIIFFTFMLNNIKCKVQVVYF